MKKYIWDSEQEFIILGKDYEIVYNYLQLQMQADDGQQISTLTRIEFLKAAHKILTDIFQKGIETNIIKEEEELANIPNTNSPQDNA